MNKRKIVLSVLIVLIVIIGGSLGTILNFATDYLWFKEMGYTSVFFTKLLSQVKLGVPFFIVITVLMLLYLRTIKKDYYSKMELSGSTFSEKSINTVAGLGAVVFGLMATLLTTTSLWFEIMSFLNKTSFKAADPIFGRDISFYIFTLPLANRVYEVLILLILIFAAMTLAYYLFLMSVRRPKIFESQFAPNYDEDNNVRYMNIKSFASDNAKEMLSLAKRQIIILVAVFFVVLAAGYFLKQFELLYSAGNSIVYGASFTDIKITLWQYRILIGLAVLAAISFAVGFSKKNYKMAFIAPVLMIIVTILGNVIAMGVQNLIVSPDEITKETKYIENNIKMTQMAYGLDKIEEKLFEAKNTLTKEDIQNNQATIENIRINDFEPTKQFYNQRQSIRLYYLFNDVDVDRYMVNGKYTQVFLSAREIDETKIKDQWITKHLKYTHGYGLTLSQVNSITASGQPNILIENLPPQSSVPEIQITRPEIYFGELTNNYIIVNTDELEFDYPAGESNNYTTYEGAAGINLTPVNRVLFAIKEGSLKLLVSSNITNDSQIIINRNIKERMEKIAPFLTYDNDPYIVVNDGKLYWMADAYTTSTYFPYSEPYSSDPETIAPTSYIRNSVKVVVDAYNGDTSFYIVDENDPIVNTLKGIFPKLFKSYDQMPEGFREHIRYPKKLFETQAAVYKKYHMNDVKVFYQGEDLWDIANEIFGQDVVQMESNYYILKLPGENDEEFVLSIPYTPKSKPNMTGMLIARNDGENYGKLISYKFPKEKTIYGPIQIESQIDQDTNISKEFSLWSQRGSTYIRGNMFVIPIEESLLYIEPVYLKAENENSLPEVKRVIAAYGDKIAYEATLDKALESLFGKSFGKTPSATPGGTDGAVNPSEVSGEVDMNGINTTTDPNELIEFASEAFENATNAQQRGDWASYGKYQEQLKQYLQQLVENGTIY